MCLQPNSLSALHDNFKMHIPPILFSYNGSRSYIAKEKREKERWIRAMQCGSDNTGAKIAFSQVSVTQTQNRTGFWVFWMLDLELGALVDSLQSACTTKTENNNRCTGVCSSSCLCYTTWVCGVIHILISGPRLEKKSNCIMNTSEAPFYSHWTDTI